MRKMLFAGATLLLAIIASPAPAATVVHSYPPEGTVPSGATVIFLNGCGPGRNMIITGGSNRVLGTNIPKPGQRRTCRPCACPR